MARLVQKTAHAPMQVGENLICMCGLSQNQPFCDSSHKTTLDEENDKLYVYSDGGREEVMTGDDCCEGGCCGGECSQEKKENNSKKK